MLETNASRKGTRTMTWDKLMDDLDATAHEARITTESSVGRTVSGAYTPGYEPRPRWFTDIYVERPDGSRTHVSKVESIISEADRDEKTAKRIARDAAHWLRVHGDDIDEAALIESATWRASLP